MATDLITLKSVEEVMAGYTPVYQPIYPLFMNGAVAYSEAVGKVDFKRVTTIGDIRGKHITPKDTEIRQIAVGESSKSFKKYFLANQYQYSGLQEGQNPDEIVAQVLDEHQVQADELFLFGEGTAANNVLNNGLYWSSDVNYTLNSSYEVAKDTGGSYLTDLHTKIVSVADDANNIAGRKLVLLYGNLGGQFDSLYAGSATPFKTSLQTVLGDNFSVVKLPKKVTPAAANGFIIANMDQVKLHYTVLPHLKNQGTNEEKMYYWFNFLMGSLMLEVIAKDGIIRQPTTLAA